MFDFVNYPFFLGIGMLNFIGNPATLNIRASMQKPDRFGFAFLVSAIIVCVVTNIIASLGYVAYGNETNDIVTLSLPHNTLTFSIQILY